MPAVFIIRKIFSTLKAVEQEKLILPLAVRWICLGGAWLIKICSNTDKQEADDRFPVLLRDCTKDCVVICYKYYMKKTYILFFDREFDDFNKNISNFLLFFVVF